MPLRRVGSKKVTEAGPERFRKEDRHPIKYFNFGRDDVVERHRSHGDPPHSESGYQQTGYAISAAAGTKTSAHDVSEARV